MTPITILLAILGGLCSAATVVGSLLKPLAPYLVLVGMGFVLCLVLSHEGCSCRRHREPRPPRRRSLDPFTRDPQSNIFNSFSRDPQRNIFNSFSRDPQSNIFNSFSRDPQSNIFNSFSHDPQGSAYKETNR
jgi:hypothetical protein